MAERTKERDEGGVGQANEGVYAFGWEPEDEEADAVVRVVRRQLKLWREAACMKQSELGSLIGYGEDMVSAVERGKRLPKPEFLDNADEALHADGRISAMKEDIRRARFPKKVRDLARLESETVELGAYGNHNIHGLLQTEEHMRALFGMRCPAYGADEIDRLVSARMSRQELFDRRPFPSLVFVQEEVTLRRLIGGREVQRKQLERLLEIGKLGHVVIQVMPTAVEEHGGMAGQLQLLKLNSGETVGHWEAHLENRLVSRPKDVQILEMRYGIIRSQALGPRDSLALIEKVWQET